MIRRTGDLTGDVNGGGENRRDVWDDGQERAGLRTLVWGGYHGDDYVVLVPDVEGVCMGVGDGGHHVQRDHSHLSILLALIFSWAQQAVCGEQCVFELATSLFNMPYTLV